MASCMKIMFMAAMVCQLIFLAVFTATRQYPSTKEASTAIKRFNGFQLAQNEVRPIHNNLVIDGESIASLKDKQPKIFAPEQRFSSAQTSGQKLSSMGISKQNLSSMGISKRNLTSSEIPKRNLTSSEISKRNLSSTGISKQNLSQLELLDQKLKLADILKQGDSSKKSSAENSKLGKVLILKPSQIQPKDQKLSSAKNIKPVLPFISENEQVEKEHYTKNNSSSKRAQTNIDSPKTSDKKHAIKIFQASSSVHNYGNETIKQVYTSDASAIESEQQRQTAENVWKNGSSGNNTNKYTYFQTIDNEEAWLYSAFFDHVAANAGRPVVRIFGLARTDAVRKVYCSLTIKGEIVATEGSFLILPDTHGVK